MKRFLLIQSVILMACLFVQAAKPASDPTVFKSNVIKSGNQFVFNAITPLVSIQFPRLTAFTGGDGGGGLWAWNCPNLADIYLPKLKSCANFDCAGNQMQVLDFPLLQTVEHFAVSGNGFLGSINCPSLVSVNHWLLIQNNPSLETVNMPLLSPANGAQIVMQNNALDQQTVDAVLIRCAATPSFVSGQVLMDGGLNSPPSASGFAAKDELLARGVTVTVNQ